MTLVLRNFLLALFALAIALPAAAEPAPRIYTQAELDQLLAPVALYPDPLLAQVMIAATYPLEVAEAARWSRANPGLTGDDAVRAVENEDWDPSVRSLVAFPPLLARMDESPNWTRALGDAFLAQEPQVMDTVQQLRHRAQAAGNLQSNEQIQVRQEDQAIVVQPVSPQYVYVPYYDPLVAYGTWWWPAYQPVYWSPWPRPFAIRVSQGFFFGNFDWRHRHVRVMQPNNFYYRQAHAAHRSITVAPQRWRHEPLRRTAAPAVLQDRRVEPQQQRLQVRTQVNALPAVQVPPAVRAQPSLQASPQVQRHERRVEHRVERREERPAARVSAPAPALQQARMPAASAPPQPRAERHEHRQERRELRQEQRRERDQKG